MAEKTGFYIESADFEKRFEKLVTSVSRDLAKEGLFTAAQAVLKAADDEPPQVPYLHGDLRASRQVKEPEIFGSEIKVSFGYNSPYAAYQHEGQRKDGSHKVKNYTRNRKPLPGPKFLEKKMIGQRRRWMWIVVNYILEKTGLEVEDVERIK